ncbi:hypothetical protein [Actinoplanes sp. DH11]|uniref:hypothetical protein n=1 Tax=Actinoplanes sp. DH11 TaxID=2857011 RepID=UPI001E5891F2|nr:hypothetical protein [Actinoplanes sp. DH11]
MLGFIRRNIRKPWALALLVAMVFGVLQIPKGPGNVSPDMTQYLNQTYDLLGDTPAEARDRTIKIYCANWGRPHLFEVSATGPYDATSATEYAEKCVERLRSQNDLAPGTVYGPALAKSGLIESPRYEAIFLSRPGVAWFYAPAVALLPDRFALGLTAFLLVALAGFLVFLMLRALRVATPIALAGQVLFYLLPITSWSIDPRGEAPVILLTTAILLGTIYVITDRVRAGVALIVAAYALGFVVKGSQFMLLGAAMAATATLALLFARRAGRPLRPLLLILGLSVAAAAVNFFGAKLMGWPGGTESMQDLLTNHYANPDVPDPVAQWLERNRYYWVWWLVEQLRAPLVLASWLIGAWGLLWARSSAAFAVFAVALGGFLNQAGHPNPTQSDRLIITAWMLVIIGVPVLLNHYVERRRRPAEPVDGPATGEPVDAADPCQAATVTIPRQRSAGEPAPATTR